MPLYKIPYDPDMPPLTDTETDAICCDNDNCVEWAEPVSVSREEHIALVKGIVDHLKESDDKEGTSCRGLLGCCRIPFLHSIHRHVDRSISGTAARLYTRQADDRCPRRHA